jgi:hypothetical protein
MGKYDFPHDIRTSKSQVVYFPQFTIGKVDSADFCVPKSSFSDIFQTLRKDQVACDRRVNKCTIIDTEQLATMGEVDSLEYRALKRSCRNGDQRRRKYEGVRDFQITK